MEEYLDWTAYMVGNFRLELAQWGTYFDGCVIEFTIDKFSFHLEIAGGAPQLGQFIGHNVHLADRAIQVVKSDLSVISKLCAN